jgi:uncharacterized protein YndB with AHSA1/START domain
MSKPTVTIRSTVQAPIESVWHAYTSPEHVTRWNFASEDWHCPRAEIDLIVGGRHWARMEAKDRSFGFDFEGVYEEIKPQEMISLVLGDGRKVRTTFADIEGATIVETVFEAESENPIEMQRDGWQAILDNFKARAESIV